MVKDNFGRIVDNIRVSVTQRCNLNCIYCHKEGENNVKNSHTEMTPEEIAKIISIAVQFDINKVKITGGEPLLRNDIIEIVSQISQIPKIKEVSMTTNGTFLSEYAFDLKKSGLKRVNISLDSLDPVKYRKLTGGGELEKVLDGINAALDAGLVPIKINVVLLKNINEDEIWNLINLTRNSNIILQVIEFVPLSKNYYKYHTSLSKLEEELLKRSKRIENRVLHRRAKYFLHPFGEVETVKPVHNSIFCANCKRIRITSDGKIKPCLMRNDNLVDIITPIRRGATEEELKELFLYAIKLREPFYK
ncbi:MAG: GTP 3',8-cyclase MoaA [Candidatus Odinarchaeia archaeon]